jgi:hypothetical protein
LPQAAVEVPASHLPAAQQPGQLDGPQPAPPLHRPPTQPSLPAQAVQAPPADPHAALSVPERQTPSASQQPLQVVGLQPQLPFSHFWLEAQASHASPPFPQASLLSPATQLSAWQQPMQLVGLHLSP